jgi:chromosome segregation ATPase
MNTFRIYEDLRTTLGEDAAKSLAHTLGPMFDELGDTPTRADIQELNATVGRLAVAQDRTETQVAAMTQAQERTETRVAALTQAQERTEAQMVALTKAQERTEAQMAALTQAQQHTEAQMAALTRAQEHTETQMVALTQAQERTETQMVALTQAQERTEAHVTALTHVVQTLALDGSRMVQRLDTVLGRTLELQFRDRLTSYLGRFMRRGRLVRNDELLEAIEPLVDADEANEVLRADAIATGVIDGVSGHVVVEVSATCGADDVDRAERRAGILRKAGLMAVPLVACEVVSRELVAYARSRQVRVWCNGTMIDAAA